MTVRAVMGGSWPLLQALCVSSVLIFSASPTASGFTVEPPPHPPHHIEPEFHADKFYQYGYQIEDKLTGEPFHCLLC